MAEKRCGLGFSCASMMQQVELRVEDCPNANVCGVAQRWEPDAEFELVLYGSSGVVPITTTRRSAAVMLLMRRGCPQSVDSFGLDDQISELTAELNQLTEEIAQYDGHYIAPADASGSPIQLSDPEASLKHQRVKPFNSTLCTGTTN